MIHIAELKKEVDFGVFQQYFTRMDGMQTAWLIYLVLLTYIHGAFQYNNVMGDTGIDKTLRKSRIDFVFSM